MIEYLFIILVFYNIDGFTKEFNYLSIFKLIIIGSLILLLNSNNIIKENYEADLVCDSIINRTEVDLSSVKRVSDETDIEYEYALQAECARTNNCYNMNKDKSIKCYYKDDPFVKISKETDKEYDDKYNSIHGNNTVDDEEDDDDDDDDDDDYYSYIYIAVFVMIMIMIMIAIYMFFKKKKM